MHRHRTAQLREAVEQCHTHLQFHDLALSPKLNPIEMGWKQAKCHWRSFNTCAKERLAEDIKELLEDYGKKFHVLFN